MSTTTATPAPTGSQLTARLKRSNQKLAREGIAIMTRERPMTLRALFYRLISAGHLENSNSAYQRLIRVMTAVREAGDVPITGWLVDSVRNTLKPSSWTGLADFGEHVRKLYRKNIWAGMPHHIELFTEKDAIAGTVYPVTSEYDVRLNIIRGDVSVSFAGAIAELWKRVQKPIYAYYLGDFDPAGFGIEKELRNKLSRYSGRTIEDKVMLASLLTDRRVYWCRLAVNAGDFDAHSLVRLPVKRNKKTGQLVPRGREFINNHGPHCAEVDAIPPPELRRRVRDAIESHIDRELWNRLKAVEDAESKKISDLF